MNSVGISDGKRVANVNGGLQGEKETEKETENISARHKRE